MTAKIEAGMGWMCTIHDAGKIKSEMPTFEMDQPIQVEHWEKFAEVYLGNKRQAVSVDISLFDLHTQVKVAMDIDDPDTGISITAVDGLVKKAESPVKGEMAAFVGITYYFLSGNGSAIQFSHAGKPDFLKITHEIANRRQIVSS